MIRIDSDTKQRPLSAEAVRRSIEDCGQVFGIIPVDTHDGPGRRRVLAGEEQLVKVRCAPGFAALVPIKRDICSVSPAYPLAGVIRSRRKRHERDAARRFEVARAKRLERALRAMNDHQRQRWARREPDRLREAGGDRRKAAVAALTEAEAMAQSEAADHEMRQDILRLARRGD